MANLSTIAHRAGVSVSTASRVLNNATPKISISNATRDRVRRAALELGYLPSGAARSMRGGRSHCLGVLGTSAHFFAPSTGPGLFSREALRGLLSAAVELGYHLTLLTGVESPPEEGGVLRDVGVVDGLLVLNRDLHPGGLYETQLRAFPKPLVYVHDYPDRDGLNIFAPDELSGGKQAVQALRAAGHERIGFVREPGYAGIFDRRERGWRAGMSEAGLSAAITWVFPDPDAAAVQIPALGITAAVCVNPPVAFNLKAAALRVGNFEREFSIVSFCHEPLEPNAPHMLANVVCPGAPLVAASLRRLVALVEGNAGPPERVLLPYTFQTGESLRSCGAVGAP